MPQLDSLRGLAIAGVIVSHLHFESPLLQIGWGRYGVELFFVLSGFLITGILLKAREQVDAGRRTGGAAVRQFFIRRVLRIFPIYYLTLAVTAIIGIAPVRETLGWHLLYASNIYFALRGDWNGPISHLWSLAVEEQFYLFWPWLILFLPRRWLRLAIVIAVVAGPLYRLGCVLLGANAIATESLLFGCLDGLGIGSLLAYLRWDDTLPEWFQRAGGWIALPLVLFFQSVVIFPQLVQAELVAGRTCRAVLFGWVVQRAAAGFRGVPGAMLSFAPLAWLGRISYGLYLFHNFAFDVAQKVLHYGFRIELPPTLAVWRTTMVAGSVLMAAVSWRYFEAPINRFKERFH